MSTNPLIGVPQGAPGLVCVSLRMSQPVWDATSARSSEVGGDTTAERDADSSAAGSPQSGQTARGGSGCRCCFRPRSDRRGRTKGCLEPSRHECLPALWRSTDRRVHLARLLLSIVGIGMIIYLFIEELFIIQALCVWCSVVHFVGFLLFAIIVTSTPALLARNSDPVPT